MRNVHAALRLALAAALGACGGEVAGANDGGSDSAPSTCNPKQTSPVPTVACGGTYTMGISGASACGIDTATGPTQSQCSTICATGTQNCLLTNDTTITCSIPFCGKARTSMRVRRGRHTLATHLRDSVKLEAASVGAFERLARELDAHGAPVSLRRGAREAARDEARHAREMKKLALRHGVRGAMKPARTPAKVRPLVDVAIENAVEGCVHETFGAALARFQSVRAADARDRAALREIARDEAKHAALAARIDAWSAAHLSNEERARVEMARKKAAHALVCGMRIPENLAGLGMPTTREAIAMARALADRLWA